MRGRALEGEETADNDRQSGEYLGIAHVEDRLRVLVPGFVMSELIQRTRLSTSSQSVSRDEKGLHPLNIFLKTDLTLLMVIASMRFNLLGYNSTSADGNLPSVNLVPSTVPFSGLYTTK